MPSDLFSESVIFQNILGACPRPPSVGMVCMPVFKHYDSTYLIFQLTSTMMTHVAMPPFSKIWTRPCYRVWPIMLIILPIMLCCSVHIIYLLAMLKNKICAQSIITIYIQICMNKSLHIQQTIQKHCFYQGVFINGSKIHHAFSQIMTVQLEQLYKLFVATF